MILILTKTKHDNKIDCDITVADQGIHKVGTLNFPNQTTWARFLGALQRGSVGMRDLEVRLDVAETQKTEGGDENATGSTNQ